MSTALQKQRLAYIDLMRGFACLLMFERHAYDAWLSPDLHWTAVYRWSAFLSTMAAPSFLLLAGIAIPLALESRERRGATPQAAALKIIRRGFIVLLWGLALRAQGFLLDWPKSPWTDVLRVDVLNVIGVSIMLVGGICWVMKSSRSRGFAAVILVMAIAMLTPPLWTSWRPSWLPWYLESYVNGVHISGTPQPFLFPIFPWAAFCAAGLGLGLLLRTHWAREHGSKMMTRFMPVAALVLAAVALAADSSSIQLYSGYDYWRTSPNFFLMRIAILLLLLTASYKASQRWSEKWLYGKLVQLGESSLLVYWVHIGLVYGRLSILPRGKSSIPTATAGLVLITVAMSVLSSLQPWLTEQWRQFVSRLRGKLSPVRQY